MVLNLYTGLFSESILQLRRRCGRLLLSLFLVFMLAGCLSPPPVDPPPVLVPPPVKKKVVVPPPVVLPPESILVVLSDSGPVYSRLAEKIRTDSGRETSILSLDSPQAGEYSLANQLKSTHGPVVAVGIEAAKFLAPRAGQRDIIFALVFNHRQLGLLNKGMIGVSMLPPPGEVLRTFKAINPQEKALSLPVRADLADYAGLARIEAKKLGLVLETPEVANDKELLLLARKLAPSIGGLWILPDNRIISKEILQQVIAVCVKSGKQTIVFSPALFPLGGLLSAEYDETATVRTILSAALAETGERGKFRGRLLSPDSGLISINAGMVKTLGLTVPAAYLPLLQGQR